MKPLSALLLFSVILFLTLFILVMVSLFRNSTPLLSAFGTQTTPTPTINPKIAQYNSILKQSWEYYQQNFIRQGQVIDPANGHTTSEGQSYALIRAWYLNDQTSFDTVWQWTKTNLQLPNKLFAWQYHNNKIIDQSPASDADQDIATALLLAYQTWHTPMYLTEAQTIMQAIWQYEVAIVNDQPYFIAGPWANRTHEIVLNPSYFSPAQYRHFATYDTTHPWQSLVDTSYQALQACSQLRINDQTSQLPLEWCALKKQTAEFVPSTDPSDNSYSFNAVRIPLRVALDYQLNKEQRAYDYLSSLKFFQQQFEEKKQLFTAYHFDGTPKEKYESALAYASYLGIINTLQPSQVEAYIDEYLQKRYYHATENNQFYWQEPQNYYTQNIAWFALALYTSSSNHRNF